MWMFWKFKYGIHFSPFIALNNLVGFLQAGHLPEGTNAVSEFLHRRRSRLDQGTDPTNAGPGTRGLIAMAAMPMKIGGTQNGTRYRHFQTGQETLHQIRIILCNSSLLVKDATPGPAPRQGVCTQGAGAPLAISAGRPISACPPTRHASVISAVVFCKANS
jgi:hypothetical protein